MGGPRGQKDAKGAPGPPKRIPKATKIDKEIRKTYIQWSTLQERIRWIDRLRGRISQKNKQCFLLNNFLSQYCMCLVFLYLIMLSCLAPLAQLTWLVWLALALLCHALLVWLFAPMFTFRAKTQDAASATSRRLVQLVQFSFVRFVQLILVEFSQFIFVWFSLVQLNQFSLVQSVQFSYFS